MKKSQLKAIVKLALQEYVQQSGLGQIIINTYKKVNKSKVHQSSKKFKPKNYLAQLQSNDLKEQTKKRLKDNLPKKMGGLSALKKNYSPKMKDFQDEEEKKKMRTIEYEDNQDEEDEEDFGQPRMTKNVSQFLNQNYEPSDSVLTLGDNLPRFLKRGLQNILNEQKSQ